MDVSGYLSRQVDLVGQRLFQGFYKRNLSVCFLGSRIDDKEFFCLFLPNKIITLHIIRHIM